MPPRWKVAFFVACVVALFLGTGCSTSVPSPELLAAAKKALQESDTKQVETLVAQIPRNAAEWQAGQLLAGEAAAKDGRLDAALKFYLDAAAKDDSTADGQLALFSAAEVHLELAQLTNAERLYRKVLQAQPNNGITNQRMAFLLSMTGRRWEALNHYFVLIKGGDATYRELALAADVGRPIEQVEFLEKCRRLSPDDELVRLALATHAFDEGAPNARELLQALVADAPELVAAQAMLGELLVDAGDETEFIAWHKSLPPDADDSPDIWFSRGLWARRQSDLQAAADCFWQSIVRTPFHRRAFYMLGQVLKAMGDTQAEAVVEYSEQMIALTQSIDHVLLSEGRDEQAVRRIAELLEQLGRTWEACAWGVVARRRFRSSNWWEDLFSRHRDRLNDQLPRIEPDKNPIAGRTMAAVPQFDRLIATVARRLAPQEIEPQTLRTVSAKISFDEERVIDFQYFNGEDLQTKGARTFETTGGGVAILDFDLDGAPDVFLPQGSEWKTGESIPTPSFRYRDRLFRNLAGREFRDVSHALAGSDSGFGQGCTAGDFNNDGFPDLYVANVGRNCLYENMGDGTFDDVTETAGITDDSWTASALVCDLNADGLPDIYDVNYLTGPDVYERICQVQACSPKVFPGDPDRLLINRGDGRFVDVPDATPRVGSKGLGIVAFETDDDRRPVLFIANDQVANFLLTNKPAANAYNIELSDDAVISGLAFNEDGLPLACMGVAIDDWDGNNLVDLFVTNFHDEANTLYLQDSPGLFVDTTKSSGLYAAGIPMTGWGVQSLDADLDGWPDLVLVNGHVDDFREAGRDYQMPPQFFRNSGGRFRELDVAELGPWFGEKYLGRGLARVDWNLDGRPDFIVSNMNSPASVLKNTSSQTGRFLRVRLHATRTARDAIGARVTLKTGDRETTRQLVAGDGYMASNERVVEFGLGELGQVDEVTIRWPSGATSHLTSPPVDSTLIVVEGSNSATRFDLFRPAAFSVTLGAEAKP